MSPPWALARGSFNIITSVRGMMGGCCQHEHFCLRIHVLTSLEPNHSNVRPNHSDRMPNHSHISRKVLAFLIPKDSHIRWNYVRKQELMAGVTVITSEILWQKELLAELIVMIWSYGRIGFYGIRNSWQEWLLWHQQFMDLAETYGKFVVTPGVIVIIEAHSRSNCYDIRSSWQKWLHDIKTTQQKWL